MRGRDEVHSALMDNVQSKLIDYPDCVMEYFIYLRQDKSPRTVSYYMDIFRNFTNAYAEELGKNVSEVTDEEMYSISTAFIDKYMLQRKEKTFVRKGVTSKISPGVQQSIINGINPFFVMAKERGYISDDPMTGKIKSPKVRVNENVVYMTQEELNIFFRNIQRELNTCGERTHNRAWSEQRRLLMMIYLTTGIRKSALTYLNIEDLHLDKGYFIATDKEDKTREYYLTEDEIKWFKDWLVYREELLNGKELDAVFINNRRERISHSSIDKIVKRYAVGIDKDITPHKLRHTYGTTLYRLTKDIYRVADELGHSGLGHVKKYAKIDEGSRKESVGLMNDFINNKISY